MQGTIGNHYGEISELCGVLPRTADFIFKEISRIKLLGNDFLLHFSAFEIYNEKIYDLLKKSKNLHLKVNIAVNVYLYLTNRSRLKILFGRI